MLLLPRLVCAVNFKPDRVKNLLSGRPPLAEGDRFDGVIDEPFNGRVDAAHSRWPSLCVYS